MTSPPLPALYAALLAGGCAEPLARAACEEVYALHCGHLPAPRSWFAIIVQIIVALALLIVTVLQLLRR